MSITLEQIARNNHPEQNVRTEFEAFTELFTSITGEETTDELDAIAWKINHFFKTRQVNDIAGVSLETLIKLPFQMRCLTIPDAIVRLRTGDNFYDGSHFNNKHLLHALTSVSLYRPFVDEIITAIESARNPAQLAARIYTAYEIENIFVHPLQEAVLLVKTLEDTSISTDKPPTDPEILGRVTQAISEFYFTARNLKTAWAYFGSENAQVFLELLESSSISQRMYQDLLQLAQKGKILYPAQLFSILLQITPAGERFSISHLIAFYEASDSNTLVSLTSALNFSITGNNRAYEYTDEQLHAAVSSEHRLSDILSFGGSVSIIEVVRAKILSGMEPSRAKEAKSRRITTIDRHNRFLAIRDALVIDDELSQPTPDRTAVVSKAHIAHEQVKANLVHLAHELPLTSTQLTELLQKHGVNPNDIHIITDQRASLLYLTKDARRTAIKTSVELLAKNGGGTYFATRGLASHLFVDLVLKIKRNDKHIAAKVVLADTTDDGVAQTGAKAAMLEPMHAELTSRIIEGVIAPKQQSRRAERLHQLQLATTLESLADQIAWSKKYGRLIFNPLDGMEFTGEIAHAVALDFGLPILASTQMSTEARQTYQSLLQQLAVFLRMLENKLDVTQFQFSCELTPSENFVHFLECLQQLPKMARNPTFREKLLSAYFFVKNQLAHKPLVSWVFSTLYPEKELIEPEVNSKKMLLEEVAVSRAQIGLFEKQVREILLAGPDTMIMRILYSAIIDALFRFHQHTSVAWYFAGPTFDTARHEDLVDQILSLLLLPKAIEREKLPHNYQQMLFLKPNLDAIYSDTNKWNSLVESAQRFFKTRNNQT